MKALLINGARTVGGIYDFNVRAAVNSQGWGLINLPTSFARQPDQSHRGHQFDHRH